MGSRENLDNVPEAERSHRGNNYNSQIFNYDMIVDIINEVRKELATCNDQLLLIDNKYRDLRVRYERARAKGHRHRAYNYRLQMETVRGVQCMYTHYRHRKQQKMDRLSSYSL